MVDASVVAKWVLPGEPHQENADRVKDDLASGIALLKALMKKRLIVRSSLVQGQSPF